MKSLVEWYIEKKALEGSFKTLIDALKLSFQDEIDRQDDPKKKEALQLKLSIRVHREYKEYKEKCYALDKDAWRKLGRAFVAHKELGETLRTFLETIYKTYNQDDFKLFEDALED